MLSFCLSPDLRLYTVIEATTHASSFYTGVIILLEDQV